MVGEFQVYRFNDYFAKWLKSMKIKENYNPALEEAAPLFAYKHFNTFPTPWESYSRATY